MSQATAMQQISDSGMTPVTSTGASFNTGKPTAGFSLYEAFAVTAQTDVRVVTIAGLVSSGLTHAEFDQAVTDSISQAAAADKLAGFAPAADAKGRDKYGPKQNTMVQRATEMRQVFGYLKATNPAMHAGGYLETLKVARTWLKEKNITWQGNAKPTEAQTQATKATAALAEATKQAMLSVAKLPGEEAGAWFARVAVEAQKLVDAESIKANDQKIEKILQGMVKVHDVSDLYNIGLSLMAYCIEAGYATQDTVATDLADVQAPAAVAE